MISLYSLISNSLFQDVLLREYQNHRRGLFSTCKDPRSELYANDIKSDPLIFSLHGSLLNLNCSLFFPNITNALVQYYPVLNNVYIWVLPSEVSTNVIKVPENEKIYYVPILIPPSSQSGVWIEAEDQVPSSKCDAGAYKVQIIEKACGYAFYNNSFRDRVVLMLHVNLDKVYNFKPDIFTSKKVFDEFKNIISNPNTISLFGTKFNVTVSTTPTTKELQEFNIDEDE